MKNIMSYGFLLVFAVFSLATAQVTLDAFDTSAADSTYEINVEGAPSRIDLSDNTTDFLEGSGSMEAHYVIGEFHQWGSYANLIYRTADDVRMDWSISDSISIWIKVVDAPTHPDYMVFRIHIADQPTIDDPVEEYIYENATVLDVAGDWYNLRVPLFERETDGTTVPNDEGFVLFPTSWGGGSYNNSVLDRDAIIGFNISAVTSGWDPANNLPADSVRVLYDSFTRFGYRAVPYIFFNGMALNGVLEGFAWGQSQYSVEEGAGAIEGTNAIKWTQGDEWGNGWSGFGFNILESMNMLGGWMSDSVKFKLKAGASTGALRVQFEGGGGKVGYVFQPETDDQWHSYSFALKDFTFQDGTTTLDTAAINVAGFMGEASAVAGNVIYIDDWWTGNPDFDVIPPDAPSNLFVVNDSYSNLVTWTDTPGETGETYNVYYSVDPITDVNAEGVQIVERGIGVSENTSNLTHLLFSPVGDSTVSFYYAVTAVDEAGNVSDVVATTSAVTNTAKGIPTIAHTTPAAWAADGALTEWTGVTPFRLFSSEGAHIVTNTTISSDDDASGLFYMAMDAENFYVAIDVTDDVVSYTAANSWEQDSPDIFIGLYNSNGRAHGSYLGEGTPDYHFRLNHDQAIIDNRGGMTVITAADADYYWEEKFPSGYVVEMRISWAALAALTGDEVFVPAEGYRIPLNYSLSDADDTGIREGILAWSPYDDDTAWQSPTYWLYSWIGNTNVVAGIADFDRTPATYALEQNYPNPFNPTTTINYSIAKAGKVTVDVYNMLGQRVAALVNAQQAPGAYSAQFDASNLASGVYFYQIVSGEFRSIKKMVLIR
jgi:hypothetical protein